MKHSVKEIVLNNGAKGLLINIPDSTILQYKFHFRAGNRQVASKDIYETAHLMEHLAFGPNAKYDSEAKYSAEFSKNGAHNNAYTSDNSMVYLGVCAEFEWDRILKLQQLAICQPKFQDEKLQSEKNNVRNELSGMLLDHNNILWYKMQQILGEDILTLEERLQTIDNIKIEDIVNHHRRTHLINNLRFVIAGKLTNRERKIKDILNKWNLRKGQELPVVKDKIESQPPTLVKQRNGKSITFGLSLIIDRTMTRKEQFAMAAINHILTGTIHSRIFGKAREKGLVYSVFSDCCNNHYNTSWDFAGQVIPEMAEELFDLIADELQAVKNGKISDEEITGAQSYALGSHQIGTETVGQISNYYSGHYFHTGEVLNYNSVANYINRVDKESIETIVKEFLNDGKWALVAVGNTNQKLIDKLNQKLKKVLNG